MADVKSKIEIALEAAAERIIGAVADSFAESAVATAAGAAAGAAQGNAGAQTGTGGTTGQAGQTTQGSAGEVKTKDDIGGPEAMEAFNVQAVKDAVVANKMLVDAYGSRTASNSKLFDITATALGMLTMGATHNQSLHMQMGTDHRDQNHDRQINLDEQVVAAAALYARLVERLNNPTPPAA